VAILYSPGNPGSERELKEVLPRAARALKLTLQPSEIKSTDDFEKVFALMSKKRPDGLYVMSGPQMGFNRKRIANLASKYRLPSTNPTSEFVAVGGLMSYSADIADSYKRIAYFVDRILKGAKPSDLPVEQPMKFDLAVNLKTAKQIGVTIDPNLLARATRIIR
jgi:putative ABC transport system substrate-binding protein